MTKSWAASYGTGRVYSGERETLVIPRGKINSEKKGIIVVHGAGASAASFFQLSLTHQIKFSLALCRAGFVIVAPDLGGTHTWGNDTVVSRIESARQFLVSLGCNQKVCLVGTSMGGLNSLNYTRAYPSRVAALIALIPAADLEMLRDTHGSSIESAWGIGSGGVLPARANPNTIENAAQIASSNADIGFYYSTAETIADAPGVEQMAEKLGVIPTVISTTMDHSDALFQFLPTNEIIDRLKAA